MDLPKFKVLVKTAVWNMQFKELQGKKERHMKVKHLSYSGRRLPQPYLKSPKFDNEMSSLLFNLRCSSVNEFNDNSHTLYGKSPPCKLCDKGIDSPCHALSCEAIIRNLTPTELILINQSHYSHLDGSIEEQLNITLIYSRILEIRVYSPQLHDDWPTRAL